MVKSSKPVELDARRPVPAFTPEKTKKKTTVDPRFNSMVGHLNEGLYDASYSFLDDMRQAEEKQLKSEVRRLSTAKRPEMLQRREDLRSKLNEYKEERRGKEKAETARKVKRDARKVERDAVKRGKNPFFLKKSAVKEQELVAKYDRLKKTGKLEKYVTKQRKKQALKDSQMAPELSTFAPRRS
eukprot:TRINITY_DN11463_c0_g1_i1.p1 TRINITY_DN11463_c0_g1~~TRINITY_DN11463_c0_g1_i1.p1  ORF type:complete len:197 (+),score=41.82 TRINITY_DN11463_c0_g1_i1:42-593(+)